MTDDDSFSTSEGLVRAVALLDETLTEPRQLPTALPELGTGDLQALELLAPWVLGEAEALDATTALAHMDPPTPWISWAMAMFNARLNQNLLHPATSPFARDAEQRVVDWLAPLFGMDGGHFCSGSTIANLTALWAARDAAGATTVVASAAAHLSIRKAANLLGMNFRTAAVDQFERMQLDTLGDLSNACLVLTAGTTSAGAIDELTIETDARWTHVDAAWAGPLRLSHRHAALLEGIDQHDSVSLSAHKWLFQPKDSAMVLFRDADRADKAISLSGGYLASPNVGVQGSRGAAAVPLLATLLAWGRNGIAQRIDRTMHIADHLHRNMKSSDRFDSRHPPQAGINLFKPKGQTADEILRSLPPGVVSSANVAGTAWLRSVAANPMADVDRITDLLECAAAGANTEDPTN